MNARYSTVSYMVIPFDIFEPAQAANFEGIQSIAIVDGVKHRPPINKMKRKNGHIQELAGHDILPPVHVILAVECRIAGIDQHLCEVDERVLHQEP